MLQAQPSEIGDAIVGRVAVDVRDLTTARLSAMVQAEAERAPAPAQQEQLCLCDFWYLRSRHWWCAA
jgi:predicted amino acid dehydrogenase